MCEGAHTGQRRDAVSKRDIPSVKENLSYHGQGAHLEKVSRRWPLLDIYFERLGEVISKY